MTHVAPPPPAPAPAAAAPRRERDSDRTGDDTFAGLLATHTATAGPAVPTPDGADDAPAEAPPGNAGAADGRTGVETETGALVTMPMPVEPPAGPTRTTAAAVPVTAPVTAAPEDGATLGGTTTQTRPAVPDAAGPLPDHATSAAGTVHASTRPGAAPGDPAQPTPTPHEATGTGEPAPAIASVPTSAPGRTPSTSQDGTPRPATSGSPTPPAVPAPTGTAPAGTAGTTSTHTALVDDPAAVDVAAPRSVEAGPGPSARTEVVAPPTEATSSGARHVEAPRGPIASAVVDRVMRAVEMLEHAPPPRRLSVEVDGLQLTIAMQGEEVSVAVRTGADLLAPTWQRDLASALRGRGLGLADGGAADGTGTQGERREQRPPSDHRDGEASSRSRTATHRSEPITDGLQL